MSALDNKRLRIAAVIRGNVCVSYLMTLPVQPVGVGQTARRDSKCSTTG